MELRDALKALDASLEVNRPQVLETLNPGAPDAARAALAREVFAGAPLPADLETWFSWHDGQHGSTPLLPGSCFVMLDAAGAARAWKEMADLQDQGALMEPWSRHWLPLFDNGRGDYLVHDGPTGRILHYRHEEERRETFAESLAALARRIPEQIEDEQQAARPRTLRWSLAQAEPLTGITSEALQAAPLGATFFGGPARLVPGLPSIPPQYLVVVKSHPREWWAIARSAESLDACFEQVRSRLAAGGDPMEWGGYDLEAAQSWLHDLLADPDGRASARATLAEVTVQQEEAA